MSIHCIEVENNTIMTDGCQSYSTLVEESFPVLRLTHTLGHKLSRQLRVAFAFQQDRSLNLARNLPRFVFSGKLDYQ